MIYDVNVLVVEDDLALQEAIVDTLELSSIKARVFLQLKKHLNF